MKRMISLLTALLMLFAVAAAEPAYPTITLNSADYGIGSVYLAKSMITTDTINPVTVAAYTAEEIAALENGESIELDEGMVLALSVNGTDTIFQYDAEDAAAILSHADPLVLNPENGELKTLEGEIVVYGAIGYPAIVLDNEGYGIGTVYFNASYFTTEHINPMTVAAYTEEEIAAITSGEGIGMPSDAVLAISVYGTDVVFFYNAEEAAAILAHADPLVLNAETGAVTTQDGDVVVAAE